MTIINNWRDTFHVLVMEKYSRTFKLLYSICLGVPVVSLNWILESEYKRGLAPIEKFLLQGPPKDKNLITNAVRLAQSGKKVFDGLFFFLIETSVPFHFPE